MPDQDSHRKLKLFPWTFQKPDFLTRKIPRKFVELVRKVAILIILMSLLGSACVHRTFTRRQIDFWSRFALQTTTLPTKFPETRCSNQENFKKDRGTGQEKFEFRPSWYRYTWFDGLTGGAQMISDEDSYCNGKCRMIIGCVKYKDIRGQGKF